MRTPSDECLSLDIFIRMVRSVRSTPTARNLNRLPSNHHILLGANCKYAIRSLIKTTMIKFTVANRSNSAVACKLADTVPSSGASDVRNGNFEPVRKRMIYIPNVCLCGLVKCTRTLTFNSKYVRPTGKLLCKTLQVAFVQTCQSIGHG